MHKGMDTGGQPGGAAPGQGMAVGQGGVRSGPFHGGLPGAGHQPIGGRPHHGTAALAVVHRVFHGAAPVTEANGTQAGIPRSPAGVEAAVAVNPHPGLTHPAFVSLGAQPLPVGKPGGGDIPTFPTASINPGVGGKEGHLGIVGNPGRAAGLGQGLYACRAVLPENLRFRQKLHGIPQGVPYGTSQKAPQNPVSLFIHRIFHLSPPRGVFF